MAVPYRRTSRSKARTRRAHHALKATGFTHCITCGDVHLPHHVCPSCGFYNGKRVLDAGVDESEVSEEAES